MKSLIEVENLSKSYTFTRKTQGFKGSFTSLFRREKLSKEAVKNIRFRIGEGECVGFLGPNGAGKTTTLKMLSGILTPTSGTAHVLGYVPWKRQKEYQKQFALVMGQKNQLLWDLPPQESFLLNKEIYGVSDADYAQTVGELVALLDVEDILDVQTRKLSLGQRMKCELIAALLHRPKVLFLDEPTIGLDVVSQQYILDFIRRINAEEKTTILLTSHNMHDIQKLCERIIIITHGHIVYDGKLHELHSEHSEIEDVIREIFLKGKTEPIRP